MGNNSVRETGSQLTSEQQAKEDLAQLKTWGSHLHEADIREIPIGEAAQFEQEFLSSTGSQVIDERILSLLEQIREEATQAWILEWHGRKTPRGTILNGRVIAGAQHNIVSDLRGETIGHYMRLPGSDTDEEQFQQMLVYI